MDGGEGGDRDVWPSEVKEMGGREREADQSSRAGRLYAWFVWRSLRRALCTRLRRSSSETPISLWSADRPSGRELSRDKCELRAFSRLW